MGIEPTSEAWEASILPLYDARSVRLFYSFTALSYNHDFPLRENHEAMLAKSLGGWRDNAGSSRFDYSSFARVPSERAMVVLAFISVLGVSATYEGTTSQHLISP